MCTTNLNLCKQDGHRAVSSMLAVIFVSVPLCQPMPGDAAEVSESKAKLQIRGCGEHSFFTIICLLENS